MKNTFFIAPVVFLIAASCTDPSAETSAPEKTREGLNNTEKNIYRSGDSMLASFKRKDWMTFVKYNHPNMIQRMGGEQAFASFVKLQMKQLPENAIKSVSLGKILQIVKTQYDEQCVVEQNMLIGLDGRSFNKKTYLVGQSVDSGNSWTFFDASTKTSLTPKEIKPDLSPILQIPAVQ